MMTELRICDFFSGLHSWTQPLKSHGINFKVFSVDNNPDYAPHTTWIGNFLDVTAEQIIEFFGGKVPHVIVASPPCTTFSIASCSTHWVRDAWLRGERIPKTPQAVIGLKLLHHLLKLIKELGCLFYFENPRGLMRKMPCLDGITRKTVWYCQYGRTDGILRAKPTDIWTNSLTWVSRRPCKNGNPECEHERAPRGSSTGTQGMKGNASRSLIPFELCEEIMFDYLLNSEWSR